MFSRGHVFLKRYKSLGLRNNYNNVERPLTFLWWYNIIVIA
jgi:hypothetical protein